MSCGEIQPLYLSSLPQRTCPPELWPERPAATAVIVMYGICVGGGMCMTSESVCCGTRTSERARLYRPSNVPYLHLHRDELPAVPASAQYVCTEAININDMDAQRDTLYRDSHLVQNTYRTSWSSLLTISLTGPGTPVLCWRMPPGQGGQTHILPWGLHPSPPLLIPILWIRHFSRTLAG